MNKEEILEEIEKIEEDGCGKDFGDRGEYTCLGKGIQLCLSCRERIEELVRELR